MGISYGLVQNILENICRSGLACMKILYPLCDGDQEVDCFWFEWSAEEANLLSKIIAGDEFWHINSLIW